MSFNVKSKFRDRAKYFRKLFFLKRRGINKSDIPNKKEEDQKNYVLKPNNYINRKVRGYFYKEPKKMNIIDFSKVKFDNIRPRSIGINLETEEVSNKFNNKEKTENIKSVTVPKQDTNADKIKLIDDIINDCSIKFNSVSYNLDNLYSDYYYIKTYSEDNEEVEKCKEIIKNLERIKKQLDEINEKFNILNKDKYLEKILNIDDNIFLDKIIKYKQLCSNIEDRKNLSKEYKKIEKYEYLYNYLNQFEKEIKIYTEKKQNKKESLEKRDNDFVEFKKVVNYTNSQEEKIANSLKNHIEISNNILTKVNEIFKKEDIKYKLVGLNEYLSFSMKYFLYLSLKPLRGIFPKIVANTMVTKQVVDMMRSKIRLEEIKKIEYYADDYENDINKYLNDTNELSNFLYSTLDDVKSLKKEFDTKYSKYQDKFVEYKDIYNKIEKMEKGLLFNLKKVNDVTNSLDNSKKQNREKLVKVKQLNKE